MTMDEAALGDAEYRNLVESANVAILRISLEGVILFANPYAHSFFGYEPGELVGQPVLGTIVPPSDSSGRDLHAMIQEILESPESHTTNENENVCKDGRRVYMVWRNHLLAGQEGETATLLSIGTDITSRWAGQAERYRLIKHQSQVQRMQGLSTLAGGVAHEINQPLSAINLTAGLIQRVLQSSRPLDRVKLEERIDRILENSQEISRIVEHLRSLIRGSSDETPSAVVLQDSVREAVFLLKTQIANHGIELSLDLWEEPIAVSAPAQQLQQVISNVVVNARQALDTQESDTKQIRIRLRREEEWAHLSIDDNGPGLGEYFHQVFHPFFTTKGPDEAMGLGLSIAHNLVTGWGGRIEGDESELGGAAFRLFLPVVG